MCSSRVRYLLSKVSAPFTNNYNPPQLKENIQQCFERDRQTETERQRQTKTETETDRDIEMRQKEREGDGVGVGEGALKCKRRKP